MNSTTVFRIPDQIADIEGLESALATGGGGGTTDHALLTNLAYADSGHTGFEPAIATGTTSQYLRGDKTWQVLSSASISGLDTQLGLKLTKTLNLSDLPNTTTARTNLGLGTIATQAANSVSITGGSINVATLQVGGVNVSLSGHTHNYEPALPSGGSMSSFLRDDRTWQPLYPSNVYGLESALSGKADYNHYHYMGDINDLSTALDNKADYSSLSSVSNDLSTHTSNSNIHFALDDNSITSTSVWSSNKIASLVDVPFSLPIPGGFTPTDAAFYILASDGTTKVFQVRGDGSLVASNHVEVPGFEDYPTTGNVQAGIKFYARPVMVTGPLVGWRMRGNTSGNCAVKVSKIAANGSTITELFTATMTAAQVASGTISHSLNSDEWIQLEVTGTPTITGVSFGLIQRRGV